MAESRTHHFRSELPDEELLHDVLTALYAPVGAALLAILAGTSADQDVLAELLAPGC